MDGEVEGGGGRVGMAERDVWDILSRGLKS